MSHSATPWSLCLLGVEGTASCSADCSGKQAHICAFNDQEPSWQHISFQPVQNNYRLCAGFVLRLGLAVGVLNLRVTFASSFIEPVLQLLWACTLLLYVGGWLDVGLWGCFIGHCVVNLGKSVSFQAGLSWMTKHQLEFVVSNHKMEKPAPLLLPLIMLLLLYHPQQYFC